MIRLPLCTAIVLCASTLWGSSVNGYVLNPLSETRVSAVEVAFYIRQDGQISEVLRKETDAQGRFSFAGPFLQDGLPFALAAFYDGVPYFSSTFEVGAQEQIILEVYETTSDRSGIHIGVHHLFFSLRESTIECIQLVQLHNSQDRAYVGSGSGRERKVTEFALPSELFNLQGHSGLMHQVEPGHFFDNQPLPPGRSQLSFSFNLNASEFSGAYVHQVIYPSDRLEIYLDPPTAELGAPFTDHGIIDLHDRKYQRVTLANLLPGQQVEIPLSISPSLRWLLKWAALGSVLLVCAAALVLSRQKAVDSAGDTVQQKRRELLEELARLDDTHADQPEDRRYLERRALLMQEAVALTRDLAE